MVTALSFYAINPEDRRKAGQRLVAERLTIEDSVGHHDLVLRGLLAMTGRRRAG
jgi:hypothetical protein